MDDKRLVAIGDIHGCAALLEELLAKIEKQWQWDTMVFLGDYIDRGPDSQGVVEQIVQLRKKYPGKIVCLKGNHEQWMMQSFADPCAHSWVFGMDGLSTITSYDQQLCEKFRKAMREMGIELIAPGKKPPLPYLEFFQEAMPAEHLRFFQGLSLYHQEPGVIFVHAGIVPEIPLEYQLEDNLLWIGEGFRRQYRGEDWIVFGHTSTKELRSDQQYKPFIGDNRIIGLDTGAVHSGILTALLWPDREFLRTPSI